MEITVTQKRNQAAHEHTMYAITAEGIEAAFGLDIDFSSILDRSWRHPVRALDFLLIAATAYAIDKIVPRAAASDRWTRNLAVSMPLQEPERWNNASEKLAAALSFLTGDSWSFAFTNAETDFAKRRKNRRKAPKNYPPSPAVSLLSGGLDSFIGAVDLLEETEEQRILFVSHYDGHVSGPASDQDKLRMLLSRRYLGRVDHLQVRTGVRLLESAAPPDNEEEGQEGGKPERYKFETTFRSRSLVFLGLAIYAAAKVGDDTPVLIPENGPIALNMPLNPSRRGSCSTRTVHPQFIGALQAALREAGINNPIKNPYEFRTKGEMVKECKSEKALKEAYTLSNSCGKAGRKTHWKNRTAKACGACVPCLFRRASLHVMGWDTELYGNDVLSANPQEYPDFHALLGLIRRNPNIAEIAKSLIANGRLPIPQLNDHAAVVRRMIDEVSIWLAAKGSPKARKLAGVKEATS